MELTFYRYQIPFKQPFTTAAGTFEERHGLFLVLHYNGQQALGEVAPLPGFSRETLEETTRWATNNRSGLQEFMIEQISTSELPQQSFPGEIPASLSFALDTLVADYRSKAAGLPARNFLSRDSSAILTINATLPIRDEETTLTKAEHLAGEGYQTLKIKVGRNAERELGIIKKLRTHFPDLNLRLDANQSWSLEEAVQYLGMLEETAIEYCEEPVAEPTFEKLQTIKKATGVRLGLDESLYQVENPHKWIDQQGADILIIKPMIMGGFQMIKQLCEIAGSNDMDIVFTTSLESSVGRMMTANLASWLGSKKLAHGLATGSLLKDDLLDDQHYLAEGKLHLPDQAGIGVQLDPQKTSLKLQKLEV